MTIEIAEIYLNVDELDGARSSWRRAARKWEDAWALKLWALTAEQALAENGQEQVTLPIPRSIVNLAERLISRDPSIDCPSASSAGGTATETEDEIAKLKARWLKAAWSRANAQAGTNLIGDAWWSSLVLGGGTFEVKWVGDVLSPMQARRRMPINIRMLNPFECGVKRGELAVEIGYHRYRSPRRDVLARYPDLKSKLLNGRRIEDVKANRTDMVDVVDYWWMDQATGDIWNAIAVDREFAKKPAKTLYAAIPFIDFACDSQPSTDGAYSRLGILDPIIDLWKYQCRLASQMATGALYHFWPFVTVMNEHGMEIPADLMVQPGKSTNLPWGTKIEMHQMSPNVPLADNLMNLVAANQQQSAFPSTLYGAIPEHMQAGYGLSMQVDAARARLDKARGNLEAAMEEVNAQMLALVEAFAPTEGMSVWGQGEREGGMYTVTLSGEHVAGYYENKTSLSPNLLGEELQKITLGIRLADSNVISKETLRNRFLAMQLPEDEEQRAMLDRALADPAIASQINRLTLERYFGPEWTQMVFGQQQQADAQKAMIEQGMPPGPTGMPPGPVPGMQIQPESMGGGLMPPQIEGQQTEDMLGLGQADPGILAALMEGE